MAKLGRVSDAEQGRSRVTRDMEKQWWGKVRQGGSWNSNGRAWPVDAVV